MPGQFKKNRPHYRLKTLLNRLHRERAARNKSLEGLWRKDVANPHREFVNDAFLDDEDDSLNNGFHREDE